jgi:predicted ester cyclase
MDNVEVVRTVEDLWNKNKTDELDQYFAPDFNNESGIPMLPRGLAGAKMAHGMTTEFLPDRNVEILDIFGAGDKVTLRQQVTFTNTKGVPWLGAPANGNKVDFQWISIYQLRDGKITGHWATIDGFTFLDKLGVWSPPAMG